MGSSLSAAGSESGEFSEGDQGVCNGRGLEAERQLIENLSGDIQLLDVEELAFLLGACDGGADGKSVVAHETSVDLLGAGEEGIDVAALPINAMEESVEGVTGLKLFPAIEGICLANAEKLNLGLCLS